MYRKHHNLTEPENSRQRLWRYLKYERLLQTINEGVLYFPHITNLSDKWEGLLTTRTKDKLFKQEYAKYNKTESANGAVTQYEQHKDAFYINSWHMNNHESYLMWKAYGDRGCAIQTTYEKLTLSLHSSQAEINVGIVNYIDYDKEQLPIGNTFYSVSYKDIAYKDEKEFRLLYWKLNLPNQNLPAEEIGVKVAVDVNILIENIYIMPVNTVDVERLTDVVKNMALSCEIKNSRIKE